MIWLEIGRIFESTFSGILATSFRQPPYPEIEMLRLDKFERYPLTFGPTPIEYLPRNILLPTAINPYLDLGKPSQIRAQRRWEQIDCR